MKKKSILIASFAVALALVFWFWGLATSVYEYTLYRNSPVSEQMRIHVATFNAAETNPAYNSENCAIAAELFAAQDGVVVRYWCEKGKYQP